MVEAADHLELVDYPCDYNRTVGLDQWRPMPVHVGVDGMGRSPGEDDQEGQGNQVQKESGKGISVAIFIVS